MAKPMQMHAGMHWLVKFNSLHCELFRDRIRLNSRLSLSPCYALSKLRSTTGFRTDKILLPVRISDGLDLRDPFARRIPSAAGRTEQEKAEVKQKDRRNDGSLLADVLSTYNGAALWNCERRGDGRCV